MIVLCSISCRVKLQLQKECLKIHAKNENKLDAAWICFSWTGRILLGMITAAFFFSPMLKITFMYKKLWDLGTIFI